MILFIKHYKKISLLALTTLISIIMVGQQGNVIDGMVKDSLTRKPIPYATIVLMGTKDSLQLDATTSNIDGKFNLKPGGEGSYLLQISHVGYKPNIHSLKITGSNNHHIGDICLRENTVQMDELVILGERIKARQEGDATTYYMNNKIQKASNTGIDVLKLIPGIQMDLMQNLSLAGNQNVAIYVDGKTRDISYLRQLNPKQIDQIKVNTSPGAEYSSTTGGVIKVILKQKETGISGHAYAEIPLSKDEIYVHPNYSINYGSKRFSLYSSYSGELTQFNITEYNNRFYEDGGKTNKILSTQEVRQDNWSHRFNVGMDYYLNENNHFNFYGYFNPYSNEHDGRAIMETAGNDIGNAYWSAQKEDRDKNYVAFSSLYYKHIFNNKSKITFDLSYYNRQATNSTRYNTDSTLMLNTNNIVSTMKPQINSGLLKIDYSIPISKDWQLNTGFKGTYKVSRDQNLEAFRFNETIFEAYGETNYSFSDCDFNVGLRYEKSNSELTDKFNYNTSSFLPFVKFNYKISERKNISFSYRSSLYRPNLYELNPSIRQDDPFIKRSGNPNLQKELKRDVFMDYSVRPGYHFLSARLFYQQKSRAIHMMTIMNQKNVFERTVQNMGKTDQFGVQFTGTLRFSKAITVNPYFKVFQYITTPNDFAMAHGVKRTEDIEFETGVSVMAALSKSLIATMNFQYSTPRNYIQSSTYNDALYMLSIEKAIRKNLKIGLTSGLPLNRSFTYRGRDVEGEKFSNQASGVINISNFFSWLKLSYNFNSGKKIKKINRKKEKIEKLPKKGF